MKRIGIILGTETSPIEGQGKEFKQYYKKHKKHFDLALKDLELNELEDLSYDIQIYALLKKNAPSNVEVIPLWKLDYTKKDLDSLDLVFGLYEFTYALQDYGFEGVTKYLNLMRTTKAVVCPNYKLQKFVMNKQAYTNYLRKHNLIKAGTSAPDNVLRKLYEDCFLSGDVYNRNVEMLLHNYMQED